MISYIPQIYPDELLFSWFCRYYAHSGYPSYVSALDDILGVRGRKLGFEFSGPISPEFLKCLKDTEDYPKMVIEHTMLPYYARYARPEARREAIECILLRKGRIQDILPFPNEAGPRYLMYCPCCAREDLDKYGEPYFHRVHQIRHIEACPVHGTRLESTGLRIYGNASPRLYAPREVIPEGFSGTPAPENVVKLARYMSCVFSAPLELDNYTPLHQYMFFKLRGKGYTDRAGTRRKLDQLLRDFQAFYVEMPSVSVTRNRLSKFLLGKVVDAKLACQIGFFLGISPEELSSPFVPEEARRPVKPIPKRNYGNRKGSHVRDWAALDRESLSLLREVLPELYVGEHGRPHRVTDRAISIAMGWPSKRLQLLPLCRAEAARFRETQLQYWAREIAWACRTLVVKNGRINRKRVRDLINLGPEQMEEAWHLVPLYAKNDEAYEWGQKLLDQKPYITFSQIVK